ncbi:MAG: hypothetical protein O6940_10125 [Ignavibacteria bacterium]|nr:hypothetical protein [Ignavibacteria bacterium]
MQEIEHLVQCSLFILIFSIFPINFLFAQVYPNQQVDSLLKLGIRNIIKQDYTKAEKNFIQLGKQYPKLPFSNIYLAACKIAEAYDYAEQYESEYIESNLEKAKKVAGDLLVSDEDNLWYNYLYALAEGYSAYYDAINENWFSALSTGINSILSFGICLNLDNKFYEAYIAIGTYEYWRSRKTEFLEWLPFYEDEINIGIEKLRKAADLASYNSYLAIYSLIWIYIDQKDFKSAIELGEKAIKEFPKSRYFKRGLARAFEDIDPKKSIDLYYEILNSYLKERNRNHINEIVLKHLIAQQYAKIGMKKNALELCNKILDIENLNDFELSKLENRLDRVIKLKISLTQ